MRKLLLLFGILWFALQLNAQCPISVQLVSTPDITTGPVCKGTPVQLQANPSAGAVNPQYIWVVNGDTLAITDTIININAYNQSVEVYMATTTGCAQDTVSETIQIQTVIIQSTVTILDSYCNPDRADIQLNSNGGTSPYSYEVVGLGTSSSGNYTDVPSGTYVVYVTDSAGCNDTNQIDITPVIPDIETQSAVDLICNQTEADVQVLSSGGSSPYTYELVGVGTSSVGTFTDVSQGTYVLYSTDSDGCTDTSEIVVTPFTCDPPNPIPAFTPNDDGYTDGWIIRNINNYPDNEVFIYDRWGQRVYHKTGYSNLDPWDAKYIGTDMPVSTYYYILKYKSGNEEQTMSGAISIFR